MIIDALLVFLWIYHPTLGTFATAAVVIAIRHVPVLADEIAYRIDAESYHGLTAYLARLALPGWTTPEMLMLRAVDGQEENEREVVGVPVPGSLVPPAQMPSDRDITRDAWLNAMANARDENGDHLFSANQIDKAIAGNRAATLARVKEIRSATLPAQFRQDEGGTAPATYPVTKQ